MASIFNDNEKLRAYLEGTASETTLAEVRAWLAEDPAHQVELDALEAMWNAAPGAAYYQQIDARADWQKVQARLQADAPDQTAPPFTQKSGPNYRIWAIAASVLLLAVVSIYFLKFAGSGTEVFETFAEEQQLKLEDGSVLTVRSHSRLTYPATFATNERRVTLEAGEAFFDVAHNPAQPFRIASGEATIEVKGTSFSVRHEGESTTVAVRTGKVQCTLKDQPAAEILLTPGQKAVLNPRNNAIAPQTNADNQFSWQSDTLTFAATPLTQVVEDIARHYNLSIETGPQFNADRTFTTQFVNQPIDDVLAEMEVVLGIKARTSNQKIILE